MKIREMFEENIERTINGVVQVEQEQESVVEQEVKEYVVTTELKKHFAKFFNEYSESFDEPTNNVGVWITGFFGSGKSHFLKMLSYLLENKDINGKKTVDYGSLTVVFIFSLTKSLKTLIISMLLSFFCCQIYEN